MKIDNYTLRPMRHSHIQPKITNNLKYVNNVSKSDYISAPYSGHISHLILLSLYLTILILIQSTQFLISGQEIVWSL